MEFKRMQIALMVVALLGATSCKKDPPTPAATSYDAQMQAVANQFVSATVIPTYSSLAKYSEELVEAIAALKADKTDANVQAACEVFLNAREWWE